MNCNECQDVEMLQIRDVNFKKRGDRSLFTIGAREGVLVCPECGHISSVLEKRP